MFKTYILDKPTLVKYDQSMFATYKSTPRVQLSTNSLSWHGQSEWTAGDKIDFLPFSNRICEYFLKTPANWVKCDPANGVKSDAAIISFSQCTIWERSVEIENGHWSYIFICFWTFTLVLFFQNRKGNDLGFPVLDMSVSKSKWKPCDHILIIR